MLVSRVGSSQTQVYFGVLCVRAPRPRCEAALLDHEQLGIRGGGILSG